MPPVQFHDRLLMHREKAIISFTELLWMAAVDCGACYSLEQFSGASIGCVVGGLCSGSGGRFDSRGVSRTLLHVRRVLHEATIKQDGNWMCRKWNEYQMYYINARYFV
ncbi:unnamed protein product [Onchocerca ochengi]|uniref:Peptidase C1A papain C-terminal domain-containing protein n=1 Tax=Onchocerca ochengi TaxID=42157 RepID=A0A182EAD7_ONCOC|nr:unnamed protein product [Onchocerca ochengi]